VIDASAVVHRLDELRAEIARGEEALRELDARRSELVSGLLRLDGAAQAFGEVIALDDATERTTVP
jgi:hypothetical protein